MILVLVGVAGSGKTTVGKLLARELNWSFVEADDYHPAANVEKMRQGIPLDDEDRRPWLESIRRRLDDALGRGENVIVACSTLKRSYRQYLAGSAPKSFRFIHLTGSEELIRQRLSQRKGHFIDPALLHSQFETLESPEGAISVDITLSPEAIVTAIRQELRL